jgi:DNA-binding IscR family transcriptional regulator
MISNSDYRKFDDMLRMVIDCSKEEAEKIEAYLEQKRQAKQIVYGTHRSEKALMTCFVTTLEGNGHVHFIDGSDGGYVLAAKQMKAQLYDQETLAKAS